MWKRFTDLILVLLIIGVFAMVFTPHNVRNELLIGDTEETIEEEATAPTEATQPTEAKEVHIHEDFHVNAAFQGYDVIRLYLNVYRDPSAGNYAWEEVNGIGIREEYKQSVDLDKAGFLGMLMPGDDYGVPVEMAELRETKTNSTVKVIRDYPGRLSQKSYKITMDPGQELWGNQRIVYLHKYEDDALRFRARLAEELINDIPQLISPHTQFVQLFVRDISNKDPRAYVNYGLYTMVEQLDEKTITNHGLSGKGELYRLNNFEFYRYSDSIKLTSDPEYVEQDMAKYLENCTGSNNQALIEMLDAINTPEMTADRLLSSYFDRENILYWMAFQILTGNLNNRSGNGNVYLYSPPDSQKWFLISSEFSSFLHRYEYERTDWSAQQEWESGITNYWYNSLFQRFLKNKQFRSELSGVIDELRGTVLTSKNIMNKAQGLQQTVSKFINTTPDKTMQTVPEWMYPHIYDRLADEVQTNYSLYLDSLKKTMPFYINMPVVESEKLHVTWEPSIDLEANDVYYTIELASDNRFSNIIDQQANLPLPSAYLSIPNPGTYYLRVIAENGSMLKQVAIDYVYTDKGILYGTKAFTVSSTGAMIEIT